MVYTVKFMRIMPMNMSVDADSETDALRIARERSHIVPGNEGYTDDYYEVSKQTERE